MKYIYIYTYMKFIIRDGAGKEKACLGFHLQKDSLDLQCHSAS